MIEKQEFKNKNNKIIIIFSFFLILLLVLLGKNVNTSKKLIISEICTNNKTLSYDYFGNYSDFIEIYNNSDYDIDLSDYYLSDNKKEIGKYKIPKTIVKAHDYALVYINQEYSGFALSAKETIYLYDGKLKRLADSVKIPELLEDETYGINDEGKYKVCSIATPGKKNVFEEIVENKISIKKPTVSFKSGFYDEPISLELLSEENYKIYYTLDSSKPTIDSYEYNGPILVKDNSDSDNVFSSVEDITPEHAYVPNYNVNKGTILRAICVDDRGNESEEIIECYFINYKNKDGYNELKTISMICDPDDLFGYENGIYVNGRVYHGEKPENYEITEPIPANYNCEGENWQRKSEIKYFDEEMNLIDEVETKISIHGYSSRKANQKSFNVFKTSENDSPFFELLGKKAESYMIRSGGNDAKEAKIRDVINQSLIRDRDVLTQDYTPVQLFINGEYWGVYMLQERVSKDYVANYANCNVDDLLVIKYNNVLKDDQAFYDEYSNIVSFITSNDMADENNYNIVNEYIDIQSFIDYVCFEVYINNLDYVTNFGMWKSKEKIDDNLLDGRWRWIIFDTEFSVEYGDTSELGIDYTACENDTFVSSPSVPIKEIPMFASLLRNNDFKKQLIITFMDMANSNFDYSNIEEKINKLQEEISTSVVESHKRFVKEDYTLEEYLDSVDVIKAFFNNRYNNITKHVKDDFDLDGDLVKVTIVNNQKDIIVINTTKTNDDFSGYYYTDYPINISIDNDDCIGFMINDNYYSNENSILVKLTSDVVIEPIYNE